MHPSTPILFFFMYKNLKKLRWRSSVDVCEKRYVHIHAEKVGFLLKILYSRGILLRNSMLMCIEIYYFDLWTMNHHIYDQNNHLSWWKISFQILMLCLSKILTVPLGARQPNCTRWNPRFWLFLVKASSLVLKTSPRWFLALGSPPGHIKVKGC